MKTQLLCLASLALVAGLCSGASAQTDIDRRLEALAIMPNDAGGRDVHAVWSVGLDGGSSASLDLSTEVLLMVNGIQVDSLGHVLATQGQIGDCDSCSGGCGTGYVDGHINTLLCLDDSQGAFIDCDCKFPSITSSFPNPPMEPGDVIEVFLRPTPGALPETSTALDALLVINQIAPTGWDRKIVDFHLEPTPQADHEHEGWINLDSISSPIYQDIDITPIIVVDVVNPATGGAKQYQFTTPCGPWIKAPGNDCDLCDGELCGKITCNGQTISEMRCKLDDDTLFCGCTSTEAYQLPIQGIEWKPGETLEIKVQGVPGALPELPGFDEPDVVLEGRWLNLGHALAGVHGDPILDGAGTLVGGDPVSFVLSNANENEAAFFVVGLDSLYAPFKGGVLVPDADLVVALDSGPVGSIQFVLPWPNGLPSGFTSYYQYWIRDGVGPVNFSASNALAATTP